MGVRINADCILAGYISPDTRRAWILLNDIGRQLQPAIVFHTGSVGSKTVSERPK